MEINFCLLTLIIASHETLTEADSSISHPLIALVALLGLTAEVAGFSQRPNNISVQATLLFHLFLSSFIFYCYCCEWLLKTQDYKHACICLTLTCTHVCMHALTHTVHE